MNKTKLLVALTPALLGLITLLLSLWFQKGSTWDDTPVKNRNFYILWSCVSGWGFILIGGIIFLYFLFFKGKKKNVGPEPEQSSFLGKAVDWSDDDEKDWEHNSAHSY